MPRILVDACGWVAVIEAGINIDLALLECCGYKDLAIVSNVISELKSLNAVSYTHLTLPTKA